MRTSSNAAARASVYERITADIIAAIERGAGSWTMPWHHNGSSAARPTNVATGARYRGVNVLALWAAAEAAGYAHGLWGTYRCWATLGAQVRKGERAALAIVWKPLAHDDDDEASANNGVDPEARRSRLFAKGFSLFNIAQVDGYDAPAAPVLAESERLAAADAFHAALRIKTEFGADMAFYRPSTDTIHMPDFSRFTDPIAFAGTLLHEAAHASGAAHRLNRDLSTRFGSHAYALEEAVAELTASFVLADLGLAHHPRPDHAAYVASWLKVLAVDPRAIFTAAAKAQQAADWMWAQQAAGSPTDAAINEPPPSGAASHSRMHANAALDIEAPRASTSPLPASSCGATSMSAPLLSPREA